MSSTQGKRGMILLDQSALEEIVRAIVREIGIAELAERVSRIERSLQPRRHAELSEN
jgi:hypothetical protein